MRLEYRYRFLLAIAALGLPSLLGCHDSNDPSPSSSQTGSLPLSMPQGLTESMAAADQWGETAEARFPVVVNRPDGPPTIKLTAAPNSNSLAFSAPPAAQSSGGQAQSNPSVGAEVGCTTCHSTRAPDLQNTAAQLDTFHQGLQFVHGNLTCYACHNSESLDTLHLADGRAIEYPDVMSLCSQCHAKQAESYAHGAHGGMNGYWDRSRGQQRKNNCVDCHDPHVPKYPSMIVEFKPKDRFHSAEASHDE